MTDQSNPQPGQSDSGAIPHIAEGFGKVPQPSESFGNVPKPSEAFRTAPHIAERKENHTLTVREVARLFEAVGVARTERSIVNWCRRDAQGFGKLDAYFDTNERRYFITPQSVDAAIAEEQAKAEKQIPVTEGLRKIPHATEARVPAAATEATIDTGKLKALESEMADLKITNRAKDYYIDQLIKERETFAAERQGYVSQLMSFNRKMGELEFKLLQIGSPSDLHSEDGHGDR